MQEQKDYFSLKSLFIPLSTKKAIWIIIILGVMVFVNSLFNPFVLDDISQIVLSPFVLKLNNIPQFFYSSNYYSGTHALAFFHINYKPLMYVFFLYTFPITYSVFPPSPCTCFSSLSILQMQFCFFIFLPVFLNDLWHFFFHLSLLSIR